jgi:DNA ligase (NAD+)
MKELAGLLGEAARAYYAESREIMPNIEYDRLYDELSSLERESGVVLAGSPTLGVGYEAVSELPKEGHPTPLLSLDKTKDPAALREWLAGRKGLISWKLDGLTVALSYSGGELSKAVTRGDGQTGEVVTGSARAFVNLPLRIPFRGRLALRGEAVISYSDFEKVNAEAGEEGMRYKNPRNLSSGSVRQLDSGVTAKRRVGFYAFALTSAETDGESPDFRNSRREQLDFLARQGFQVVESFIVDEGDVEERVRWFEERARENDLPSDGLVLAYDDIAYAASLGSTSRFPRDSIAFKWADELAETTLRGIEWSASRTGLINPIAVFDPVELEGTTVSRASVHNVSILEELGLGPGDRVTVYKANMIIPQIAENLTRGGAAAIPGECPVCGCGTELRDESGVKFLCCPNEGCLAKRVKSFAHFVSRDAMNIEGVSEATIEKLIAAGLVKEPADLFRLGRFRDEIAGMDGLGERSFENMAAAADRARLTTQARLLYSLGIPGIGPAGAKLICQAFGWDWERIRNAGRDELTAIDGIGAVTAEAFARHFEDPGSAAAADRLLAELSFRPAPGQSGGGLFEGLSFAITGGLALYPNRNALKAAIEALGGRVAGGVTSKTDYLVNNDRLSASAKNRAAREFGVAIIDEGQLAEWMGGGPAPETGRPSGAC